jgi:hypothetical protein
MSLKIPKHKYFATKALYDEQLKAEQIKDTDLCFIAETREIIVNGRSFGYLGQSDIEVGADTSTLATKEELAECEEVAAAALNELNDRVNELSESVSGTTVTKEELTETIDAINATIIENEEISAAALTDLNDKIKALEQRIKELEAANQNV